VEVWKKQSRLGPDGLDYFPRSLHALQQVCSFHVTVKFFRSFCKRLERHRPKLIAFSNKDVGLVSSEAVKKFFGHPHGDATLWFNLILAMDVLKKKVEAEMRKLSRSKKRAPPTTSPVLLVAAPLPLLPISAPSLPSLSAFSHLADLTPSTLSSVQVVPISGEGSRCFYRSVLYGMGLDDSLQSIQSLSSTLAQIVHSITDASLLCIFGFPGVVPVASASQVERAKNDYLQSADFKSHRWGGTLEMYLLSYYYKGELEFLVVDDKSQHPLKHYSMKSLYDASSPVHNTSSSPINFVLPSIDFLPPRFQIALHHCSYRGGGGNRNHYNAMYYMMEGREEPLKLWPLLQSESQELCTIREEQLLSAATVSSEAVLQQHKQQLQSDHLIARQLKTVSSPPTGNELTAPTCPHEQQADYNQSAGGIVEADHSLLLTHPHYAVSPHIPIRNRLNTSISIVPLPSPSTSYSPSVVIPFFLPHEASTVALGFASSPSPDSQSESVLRDKVDEISDSSDSAPPIGELDDGIPPNIDMDDDTSSVGDLSRPNPFPILSPPTRDNNNASPMGSEVLPLLLHNTHIPTSSLSTDMDETESGQRSSFFLQSHSPSTSHYLQTYSDDDEKESRSHLLPSSSLNHQDDSLLSTVNNIDDPIFREFLTAEYSGTAPLSSGRNLDSSSTVVQVNSRLPKELNSSQAMDESDDYIPSQSISQSMMELSRTCDVAAVSTESNTELATFVPVDISSPLSSPSPPSFHNLSRNQAASVTEVESLFGLMRMSIVVLVGHGMLCA
jgi:hypothetical protein